MKIFMVHEDPWHAGNPYISTLIEQMRDTHPESLVAWGRAPFWSEEICSYDIVHFHWPQAFMAYDSHTDEDLLRHLELMKANGVRIVATCHDLEPHYSQCADKAESLKMVYSHCDAIFHLGTYSQHLFEAKYPQAAHLLLPHHLYDTIYHDFPSKEASLKQLRLRPGCTYILCFGTFRADVERQLVIDLYRQLNDRQVYILAPGFMDVWQLSWKILPRLAKKISYRYKYHIRCTGKTWGAVSDADLPYYYGAADVAFIQRLKILNSGNALMPMLYGKVVVGPDCGNVGPLLKEWGYPVFQVDDVQSIGKIVSQAIRMGKDGYGVQHRDAQLTQYSTSHISALLYSFYQALLTA
ncbi:MAG: hypothetical protein K6D37_00640 [Prevotella sp.]|nr:hypothetical protein [Prevotella sp.]